LTESKKKSNYFSLLLFFLSKAQKKGRSQRPGLANKVCLPVDKLLDKQSLSTDKETKFLKSGLSRNRKRKIV
jgi:hypothetical protein